MWLLCGHHHPSKPRPSQLSQGITWQMIPLRTQPLRGALQMSQFQWGKWCPLAASPGTQISRPT